MASTTTRDPITMEVLRNAMVHVVANMENGMRRTAFSMLARELGDLACTIHTPTSLGFDLVAAASGIPALFACSHSMVRENVVEFGIEELQPGDELLFNDPFRGGNHAQDFTLARPVFHEGEIIAFCTTRSHWADVGGATMGSWPAGGTVRTIMEETSLRIPPILAYRGGVPVKSTHSLILDGTRTPLLVLGDLRAQHTANTIGERQLLALVERHGADTIRDAMRYALDYAEARMRAAIATIPDGIYEAEDTIDDDGVIRGPFPVHVAITVRGEEAELDFSGTGRQTESNCSAPWGHAACCALLSFCCLTDPTIPLNGGSFRPIDLLLPEGSLVHALPYHACVDGSGTMSPRILSTVLLAMNQARPETAAGDFYGTATVANMGGVTPAGPDRPAMPWILYTAGFSGFGATAAGDGHSFSTVPLANAIDASVEAMELDNPVVVVRKEFAADSGGPGQHRGGPGVALEVGVLAPATISNSSDRVSAGGFGAAGGKGSHRSFIDTVDGIEAAIQGDIGQPTMVTGLTTGPTGEEIFRTGKFHGRTLRPDTVWRSHIPGGGGWGDPLARDPQRVVADVAAGLVTTEGAASDYGVVVDASGALNEAETADLRRRLVDSAEFRDRPGPATWAAPRYVVPEGDPR